MADTTTELGWCNCQNPTTWHPVGDTSFCPAPPELLMGQNMQGETRIIQALWPSGVRADWYRQISVCGSGAHMSAEQARERAAEMVAEARDLVRAADWLASHLDDMTGYNGETSS